MLSPDMLSLIQYALAPAQRVLCISHVGPDGDAIGSLVGMGWILHALGKEPTLALQDPLPDGFDEMPGAEKIIHAEQVAATYDLIVCLDSSSPDRMGRIFRPDDHDAIPMVVVDHHVTNTNFGDVNWVEPRCAATCQMLVYLAQELNVPLTGPLAECLLTGIVTDTLCFRTSNTDADVLAAATLLIQGGADLAAITARTLNRRRFTTLKLLAIVLADTQLVQRVIWTTISRAQLAETGNESGEDMQLNSMLIATREADISATFTEKLADDGTPAVECSFRAKPGFDVSKLAYELGGGGHPPASGCTLPGSLDQVVARVVPLLQEAQSRQASGQTGAPV